MSRSHFASGPPIVLIRRGFQRLFRHAAAHEPLRNQIIIAFPTRMGLRTGEIVALYGHDIKIDTGRVMVTNSKSKHVYPIPLPYSIAEILERYEYSKDQPLIQRLLGSSYRSRNGTPLHPTAITKLWHEIALRAGLDNPELYTPTFGRHYFAATSAFNPDPKKRLNIETIRRIMRHKSLAYTQVYLSRLVFFEDIQADINRVQEIPGVTKKMRAYPSVNVVGGGRGDSSQAFRDFCYECTHFPICKYKEEMAACAIAECPYFSSRKRRYMPDIQFMKPSRVRKHRDRTYIRGDVYG